ncbi:hypothetical protein LAWI1_G004832, partial [Lachnellula willkommii]
PFTKSPQHAKWPALFKKSLGVTEAHIRKLDRVMQSMKSEMVEMGEQERLEWELGSRGNWRRICGMMDRAREILAQEREAAKGILPAKYLRDKKGLGVAGTNFEPLGPKLAERAEALGFNNQEPEQNGANTDSEGDSEMEDVSSLNSDSDNSDLSSDSSDLDSSSDSEAEKENQEPVSNGRKVSVSVEEEETTSRKKAVPVVEPNPYFVVDTEPMPLRGLEKPSLSSLKKGKKRSEDADGDAKKSKKAKKEKVVEETVQSEPEPKAEEPAVQKGEKKSKKRGNDEDGEVKKSKKSKNETVVIAEPEPTAAAQSESEPAAEPPKKSKKRSHSDADTESKKTKKHKSTTVVEVTEQQAPASNVDFAEVQRKLQAEVDAGVAAKEAEKAAEKAKKKRRRSSGEGGDESVKKVRKGKST